MRTGGCTITQTLTTEAASVLKHSLNLAKRRGHAQVTPLHVAATLLSSRTSLLRRACLKSHPGFQFTPSHHHHNHHHHHHHPLQCRALELCFNVALNRLPTVPGPIFHGQPSLANALIAALKRAQAHQRRGCIEQQQQSQSQSQSQLQQQPPLLTIKVELEQLVISILDDPSVSRVMREAGFSSTAVKSCIEDSSVSTVFYGSSVGVFSSNNQHINPKDLYQPLMNPNTFWQTQLLNHSPQQNPFINKKLGPLFIGDSLDYFKEDVKLVIDVLLRNKKRNPVIVGDSVSFTEGLVAEIISKIERGDLDHNELKQTHFIKFQFSPITLKFMRREDVGNNVSELRKKVISFTSSGKSVIIYTGDLNWTIGENNNGGVQNSSSSSSSSSYNPSDHILEELGRLISEYNKNNDEENSNGLINSSKKKTKIWIMGTASYNTYMRCQKRKPSLETLWSLQAVSVPSAGLGLTLHATSEEEESRKKDNNESQVVGEAKSFGDKSEENPSLIMMNCCSECISNYEIEANSFKSNQQKQKLLPSWLQLHGDTSQIKDELIELRRKWSRFCQSLHHGKTDQTRRFGVGLSMMEKGYSNGMAYRGLSNQTNGSASVSFTQRGSNSVAKFRRQNSSTLEFDLGCESENYDRRKLNPLSESEGKDMEMSLVVGHSLFMSESEREMRNLISSLVKSLEENIPWQKESVNPIAEILMDYLSCKKDTWFMISGNEISGKRRLALAISESLFGSVDVLVHIKNGANSKMMANALKKREKVVFLIEDIDSADANLLKLLSERFDDNMDRQAIFILTKEDSDFNNGKTLDSVLQIGLEISDRKRKPESELSSPKESKNLKTATYNIIKREIYSRQSSFNSSLDLNIKAEESDEEEEGSKPGEISPISSDLTGDELQISSIGFLDRIKNRFEFDRESKKTRDEFAAKIGGIFGEIYRGEEGIRFSIEEKVTEEIYRGCGNFLNGKFEGWLKEVIGKGLLTVKKGGKKDTSVIRMVFGGIVDKQHGGEGYMGTCLPNKVQVI